MFLKYGVFVGNKIDKKIIKNIGENMFRWLINESYFFYFDILVLCNEIILYICSMLI